MKLNEIKPARGAVKRRKRLGCGTGSGHGGTSTQGHKGQQSRSGGGVPPWFEGGQMPLQRRVPKRGFHNFARIEYEVVNVGDLGRFAAGSEVGLAELCDARLVRRTDRPVKILGTGTIDHALTIHVHAASKAAVEKIEQSGGKVEILSKA
ncbi:MAG: 50S ribosomal protein L15 [Candidatus Eisenbacteria sp.]|nr:50S ribosomal protein L15 [Candidatus Eisenbacteria bacterium]